MAQLQENQLFANRYRLVKRLGSGAFSEVWKAEDVEAGNMVVALKIYAPDKGMDDEGIAIFSQEYALVFNVAHQNLLRPSFFGKSEGSPFLVLPFCERGSCTRHIGGMDEQHVAKFLHDVAAGLSYLHQQTPPIIHQDIKPDNVLISNNGDYKLTDFGISTRVRTTLRRSMVSRSSGSSGGTMAYMAPERFERQNEPIKASDIWSLGATAYEMMTGDAPFGDLGGIALKNGAEIPEAKGNFSEEVKLLIDKLLSKAPWDRPTAQQIADITEIYLKNGRWLLPEEWQNNSIPEPEPEPTPDPIPEPAPAPIYISEKPKKRNGISIILTSVVIAVIAALAFFFFGNNESDPDRENYNYLIKKTSEIIEMASPEKSQVLGMLIEARKTLDEAVVYEKKNAKRFPKIYNKSVMLSDSLNAKTDIVYKQWKAAADAQKSIDPKLAKRIYERLLELKHDDEVLDNYNKINDL